MTTAIILAGGLGTRLRSVVPDLPKPMAPVAGRPFLAHQLDFWIAQGVRRFILAVGYRHEAIVQHFGDSYRDATLRVFGRAVRRWAPAGRCCKRRRASTTSARLLLNGDTWFDVPLPALAFRARRNTSPIGALRCSATTRPGATVGVGVDRAGPRPARLSQSPPRQLANGGVCVVSPGCSRAVTIAGL